MLWREHLFDRASARSAGFWHRLIAASSDKRGGKQTGQSSEDHPASIARNVPDFNT